MNDPLEQFDVLNVVSLGNFSLTNPSLDGASPNCPSSRELREYAINEPEPDTGNYLPCVITKFELYQQALFRQEQNALPVNRRWSEIFILPTSKVKKNKKVLLYSLAAASEADEHRFTEVLDRLNSLAIRPRRPRWQPGDNTSIIWDELNSCARPTRRVSPTHFPVYPAYPHDPEGIYRAMITWKMYDHHTAMALRDVNYFRNLSPQPTLDAQLRADYKLAFSQWHLKLSEKKAAHALELIAAKRTIYPEFYGMSFDSIRQDARLPLNHPPTHYLRSFPENYRLHSEQRIFDLFHTSGIQLVDFTNLMTRRAYRLEEPGANYILGHANVMKQDLLPTYLPGAKWKLHFFKDKYDLTGAQVSTARTWLHEDVLFVWHKQYLATQNPAALNLLETDPVFIKTVHETEYLWPFMQQSGFTAFAESVEEMSTFLFIIYLPYGGLSYTMLYARLIHFLYAQYNFHLPFLDARQKCNAHFHSLIARIVSPLCTFVTWAITPIRALFTKVADNVCSFIAKFPLTKK